MNDLEDRIFEVGHDAVRWSFSRGPYVVLPTGGSWPRTEDVDPFPCYSHDRGLVLETAEVIEATFPLPPERRPRYVLLGFDTSSRVNGWTSYAEDHDAEEDENGRSPWRPYIAFAGKRIPPHPGMTRYLVAHEYAHCLHLYLEWLAGHSLGSDKLYPAYDEMRGLKPPDSYGGGTWHASTSEVFANDFRILLAQVELEYWPHPGIPRPEEIPAVADWWAQALSSHRYQPTGPASKRRRRGKKRDQ
jgi:hypothetical protein